MLNAIKADIEKIPPNFAHPGFHWNAYPMSLSSLVQFCSLFLIGASLIVLLWIFLDKICSTNIALCHSIGSKVYVGAFYVVFVIAVLIAFELLLAGVL